MEAVRDYTRWTKESLIKKVQKLEEELKRRPLPAAEEPTTQPPAKQQKKNAGATNGSKKKKKDASFDPSRYSTRLIALKLAYLGKNYSGFEYTASGAVPSIEEELWKALVRSCLIFPEKPDEVNFAPWEYSKCGRTDRGVSAFGQVIGIRVRSNRPLPKKKVVVEAVEKSEDVEMKEADDGASAPAPAQEEEGKGVKATSKPDPEEGKPEWDPIADEIQYCRVLNRLLPPDIRILAWAPSLPEDFSARFSCRERQYRYFFTQPAFAPPPSGLESAAGRELAARSGGKLREGWLDIDAMRQAAKLYEGAHDFRNFCKVDPSKQITDFTRRIFEADIVEVNDVDSALTYLNQAGYKPSANQDGEEIAHPKVYYFHVRGSAFLWHQIRCMVAVLFLVGQGLEKPSVITELLDIQKYPRKPHYVMADEVPLVLWDCIFPKLDGEAGANEHANADVHDHTLDLTNAKPLEDDAIDWLWVGEDDPVFLHGSSGIVNELWEGWRAKKMDEILAGRLLDAVAGRKGLDLNKRACQGGRAALTKKKASEEDPNCPLVFDGANSGRSRGVYVPMLERRTLASPQETNDKWAQAKGFASAAEMAEVKNWRTMIREAKKNGDGKVVLGGAVAPEQGESEPTPAAAAGAA